MTAMAERKPISKKTRFEVFKRDKFTCQYCGAKAPEVVLHCDHVNPVAAGGDNDIMNLVAACADCNGGKGARKLDDRSAVERQRAQIEELESRREQLEMMLAWRDAAHEETVDTVEEVASRIGERGGYWPNESGKADIRKWLKRYSLSEILAAMDEAFDHYMKFDGSDPDQRAWNVAFRKIPVFASMRRQAQDKPYLPRLLYIQGIMRKRSEEPHENFVDRLEVAIEKGWSVDDLETVAKKTYGWGGMVDELAKIARQRRGQ
jgi:hypothetical protein